MRDYKTVNLVSTAAAKGKMSWREIVKASLGVRSTIYGYVGGALQLFASAAIVAWIPSYLNRFYALPPEEAAVKGGFDRLGRWNRHVVWWFCGGSFERSGCSQQAARSGRICGLFRGVVCGGIRTTKVLCSSR